VRHSKSDPRCPLWVKSGHCAVWNPCPLYPQKRTLVVRVEMSALCQKRTSVECFGCSLTAKADSWEQLSVEKIEQRPDACN
jgi:hypothetical protein